MLIFYVDLRSHKGSLRNSHGGGPDWPIDHVSSWTNGRRVTSSLEKDSFSSFPSKEHLSLFRELSLHSYNRTWSWEGIIVLGAPSYRTLVCYKEVYPKNERYHYSSVHFALL